jgi:predicted PP-loop superfamily ATPase
MTRARTKENSVAILSLEQGTALASLGLKPFTSALRKYLKLDKNKKTKEDLADIYREFLKGRHANLKIVEASMDVALARSGGIASQDKLRDSLTASRSTSSSDEVAGPAQVRQRAKSKAIVRSSQPRRQPGRKLAKSVAKGRTIGITTKNSGRRKRS